MSSRFLRFEYDNRPGTSTESRQIARSPLKDLLWTCEQAAENEEEVLIAIRQFPEANYVFRYKKPEVEFVQAKLRLMGYQVDIKTVMNEHCSKVILVVEKDMVSRKQVHAERLKDVR